MNLPGSSEHLIDLIHVNTEKYFLTCSLENEGNSLGHSDSIASDQMNSMIPDVKQSLSIFPNAHKITSIIYLDRFVDLSDPACV